MYRFIVENKKFIYGIGYIVTAPYTITNAIGVKYNNNNGTHIFMKNLKMNQLKNVLRLLYGEIYFGHCMVLK